MTGCAFGLDLVASVGTTPHHGHAERHLASRRMALRRAPQQWVVLYLLLALAFSGLVIGALGRLVVPGPNPMGLGATILVGLAGSFLGGLLGRLVFGLRYRYSLGLGLGLSVLFAALIVALLARRRPRLY